MSGISQAALGASSGHPHSFSNEARITIDFETRSACSIKAHGAWLYSKHPTTEVLCLAFRLIGDDEVEHLWHSGFWTHDERDPEREWVPAGMWREDQIPEPQRRTLEDLYARIRAGDPLEAHNVFFEMVIWDHIASQPRGKPTASDPGGWRRGMGAPPVPMTQWRCSAAKAAAYALPRPLKGACEAMSLSVLKDADGSAIMRKVCKPRSNRKAEIMEDILNDEEGKRDRYHETRELYEGLFSYCVTDVRAEHTLSAAVPDLSPHESMVWLADLRANKRGIRVDVELCHAAIRMGAKVRDSMNRELKRITGIPHGTLRQQIKDWIRDHEGVVLVDTTSGTLDWFMGTPEFKAMSPGGQRVIEIARNINRTSVKKFERILQMRDPEDDRVRELVMYHAATTGRWGGKGIQVQNFPRGELGEVSMEEACADVLAGDVEWCEFKYGDVMGLLSWIARGALVASEGRRFVSADYSAIEARVVLWLCNAAAALGVFRSGGDIYCDMAASIYGRPVTKADKHERQFGKVTILGLGYGMGYLTFLLTLRMPNYGSMRFTVEQVQGIMRDQYDVYLDWVTKRLSPEPEHFKDKDEPKSAYADAKKVAANERKRLLKGNEKPDEILHELALCKYTVDAYRSRYKEVPAGWKAQEKAAIRAVEEAGTPIREGQVTWLCEKDKVLKCILPSGRSLNYLFPRLREVATPWGTTRNELRYKGVDKNTKQWKETGTYGGRIVENITQAIARDMMAFAVVEIDLHDVYDLIMTVHDECVSEADDDKGSVEEFEGLMVALPGCYDGCPVTAEGGTFMRYQK